MDQETKCKRVVIDFPYTICARCQRVETSKCRKKKCVSVRQPVDEQRQPSHERTTKNECAGLDKSEQMESRRTAASKQKSAESVSRHSRTAACDLNNDANVYADATRRYKKSQEIHAVVSRIKDVNKLNVCVDKKWNKLKTFRIPEGGGNDDNLKELYEKFEESYGKANSCILDAKKHLDHNMELLKMIQIEQDKLSNRNNVQTKCILCRCAIWLCQFLFGESSPV